jgi:hypothetical protein
MASNRNLSGFVCLLIVLFDLFKIHTLIGAYLKNLDLLIIFY